MKSHFHASAAAGIALVLFGLASLALAADGKPSSDGSVARGKYLVQVAGCNDCHTAGFAMSGGKVPESEWLTGDALGWQGPWGTTYAANLRLYMKDKTEAQWLAAAKAFQSRPPMPFWSITGMTEADQKAIYRYVKTLPVKGEAAPPYLPPGTPAKGPVVTFPAPPAKPAGK
jgi:mono/diheme cytochrome c family protein